LAYSDVEYRRDLLTAFKQGGWIRTVATEKAFANVPRDVFIPGVPAAKAYADRSHPVKMQDGVIISSSSQPATMAEMLEQASSSPIAATMGLCDGERLALFAVGSDGIFIRSFGNGASLVERLVYIEAWHESGRPRNSDLLVRAYPATGVIESQPAASFEEGTYTMSLPSSTWFCFGLSPPIDRRSVPQKVNSVGGLGTTLTPFLPRTEIHNRAREVEKDVELAPDGITD